MACLPQPLTVQEIAARVARKVAAAGAACARDMSGVANWLKPKLAAHAGMTVVLA